MRTFARLDAFVTSTAQLHETDGKALAYCALGVSGEAGECAELVKKSMRAGQVLDPAKLMLELGDVLWYVTRTAQVLGFGSEDVTRLLEMKILRRAENGKDGAAELVTARQLLGLPELV